MVFFCINKPYNPFPFLKKQYTLTWSLKIGFNFSLSAKLTKKLLEKEINLLFYFQISVHLFTFANNEKKHAVDSNLIFCSQ